MGGCYFCAIHHYRLAFLRPLFTTCHTIKTSTKEVNDRFTKASAATTSGGAVGEAAVEAEHRAIEELGQKRRLLMAVNESKEKPVRRLMMAMVVMSFNAVRRSQR